MGNNLFAQYYTFDKGKKTFMPMLDMQEPLDENWEPSRLNIPEETAYFEIFTESNEDQPHERVLLVEKIFDQERAEYWNESLAAHMDKNGITHAAFQGNGVSRLFIPKPNQKIFVEGTTNIVTVPEDGNLSQYVNDGIPDHPAETDENREFNRKAANPVPEETPEPLDRRDVPQPGLQIIPIHDIVKEEKKRIPSPPPPPPADQEPVKPARKPLIH